MNTGWDLSGVWDAAKQRWSRLALWDVLPDQTHVQHALIVAVLWSALGVLRYALWHRFAIASLTDGLAQGVAAGLVFYIVREIIVEHVAYWLIHGREDPTNSWWDSTLDWLVPFLWCGWLPIAARYVVLPWQLTLVWWLLNVAVLWLYTFGRPSWAHA